MFPKHVDTLVNPVYSFKPGERFSVTCTLWVSAYSNFPEHSPRRVSNFWSRFASNVSVAPESKYCISKQTCNNTECNCKSVQNRSQTCCTARTIDSGVWFWAVARWPYWPYRANRAPHRPHWCFRSRFYHACRIDEGLKVMRMRSNWIDFGGECKEKRRTDASTTVITF